jgi:hypothetical protein
MEQIFGFLSLSVFLLSACFFSSEDADGAMGDGEGEGEAGGEGEGEAIDGEGEQEPACLLPTVDPDPDGIDPACTLIDGACPAGCSLTQGYAVRPECCTDYSLIPLDCVEGEGAIGGALFCVVNASSGQVFLSSGGSLSLQAWPRCDEQMRTAVLEGGDCAAQ